MLKFCFFIIGLVHEAQTIIKNIWYSFEVRHQCTDENLCEQSYNATKQQIESYGYDDEEEKEM